MIASILLLALVAPSPDDPETAKALAERLTAEGARTFETKSTLGMSASYVDDAILTIVSKEKGSSDLKTETKRGRVEIEAFYRQIFENDAAWHPKNSVEHARRVSDDVLIIVGTFTPDVDGDLKIPFVQTRARDGDPWRITNLQIFIFP